MYYSKLLSIEVVMFVLLLTFDICISNNCLMYLRVLTFKYSINKMMSQNPSPNTKESFDTSIAKISKQLDRNCASY